jgi:hypothetical protein
MSVSSLESEVAKLSKQLAEQDAKHMEKLEAILSALKQMKLAAQKSALEGAKSRESGSKKLAYSACNKMMQVLYVDENNPARVEMMSYLEQPQKKLNDRSIIEDAEVNEDVKKALEGVKDSDYGKKFMQVIWEKYVRNDFSTVKSQLNELRSNLNKQAQEVSTPVKVSPPRPRRPVPVQPQGEESDSE